MNSAVVIEVAVAGGRQVLNFPVAQLPAVAELVAEVAADEDVLALIAANTPEPAPESEPEGEPIP